MILSIVNGFAQDQKERIVIVPFNRFAFQSAFSLEEIALFNDWNSQDVVYQKYKNFLIEKLSKGNEALSFFELPENEQIDLDRLLPKIYKTEPINHSGVDLSPIIESGKLKVLLENLAADYILFLNQYTIETKLLATKSAFDGSKFLAWSMHFLTYELYNEKGELIALADRLKLEPKPPNKKNYQTRGTILKNMDVAYQAVITDILKKVNKNRRLKEPIYKVK